MTSQVHKIFFQSTARTRFSPQMTHKKINPLSVNAEPTRLLSETNRICDAIITKSPSKHH